MKCFKCKNEVSWAKMDCVYADGKHGTVKKKVYCQKCYFNKPRMVEMRKGSFSLNDLFEQLNKESK